MQVCWLEYIPSNKFDCKNRLYLESVTLSIKFPFAAIFQRRNVFIVIILRQSLLDFGWIVNYLMLFSVLIKGQLLCHSENVIICTSQHDLHNYSGKLQYTMHILQCLSF